MAAVKQLRGGRGGYCFRCRDGRREKHVKRCSRTQRV